MNRGVQDGKKRLALPDYLGVGDPANDGKLLQLDSTAPGGVKLLPNGTFVAPSTAIPRYPLTVKSRGALVLPNGIQVGNSENFIQPEQLIKGEDGNHYLTYTGTGPSGLCFLVAKSTSGPMGPYVDSGTFLSYQDGACVVFDGATWHLFGGQTGTTNLHRFTSATFPSSTWTDQGAVVSIGAAGSPGDWDATRIAEPWVMRDPRPGQSGWLMFYMGLNQNVTPQSEQVGLAVAATLAGPWTKVTSLVTPPFGQGKGSGLILPAAGVNTALDGTEVSDPWCVYLDGVFYLFYSAAPWASAQATAYVMLATATDPVNGPWTKQGLAMERGIWPAPDSCGVNRGSFFWADDNNIYYPYEGGQISEAAPGTVGYHQGYMAVIDPAGFIGGPRQSPWIRVEAEATDSRIVTHGTWATESTATSSALHDIFSGTVGDSVDFHFAGRRVRVGGQACLQNGIFSVTLDGTVVVAAQDMYANDNSVTTPVLVYDSGDIGAGLHKLTLTVTGKNPSATHSYLVVDYFEFVPSPGGAS